MGLTLFATSIDPCHHMKVLLSRLSDGSLTGLGKWYTKLHAAGCPKCGTALEALRQLPPTLREMAEKEATDSDPLGLSADRWKRIEDAWGEESR